MMLDGRRDVCASAQFPSLGPASHQSSPSKKNTSANRFANVRSPQRYAGTSYAFILCRVFSATAVDSASDQMPAEGARQSRLMSLTEAATNVVAGFGLGVLSQRIVLPWFGAHLSMSDNLMLGGLFTLISI